MLNNKLLKLPCETILKLRYIIFYFQTILFIVAVVPLVKPHKIIPVNLAKSLNDNNI